MKQSEPRHISHHYMTVFVDYLNLMEDQWQIPETFDTLHRNCMLASWNRISYVWST